MKKFTWLGIVSVLLIPGALAIAQLSKPTRLPSLPVRLGNLSSNSIPQNKLVLNIPISYQEGLLGEYYNTENLDGRADFIRIDSKIDFEWPDGFPINTSIINDGTYAERWTGYIYISYSGDWDFLVTSDDGFRLYLDNLLVSEDWSIHSPYQAVQSVTLFQGWHKIKLEHFNRYSPYGVQATIMLELAGPSTPLHVVGPDELCLDPTASARASVTQYGGRTYKLKAVMAR